MGNTRFLLDRMGVNVQNVASKWKFPPTREKAEKENGVQIAESKPFLGTDAVVAVLNSISNFEEEESAMPRRVRSNCTVGTFEKTRGLPPGTIRNSNGRDTRSDKKIETIRKEYEKKKKR